MPVINCPNCGAQLNAPDSLLGQQVSCGKCGCLFVAQSQTPPSAQAGAEQAQGLQAAAPAAAGPAATPPQAPPMGAPPMGAPPMFAPPPLTGQMGYQQVTGGYYQPAPLATSGYAVASLVLGIASLVTCMCYGVPAIICGPLAMVFSSRAGNDIRAGLVNPSSADMATAGKICGLIGLLLGIGFLILVVVGITASTMTHG